MTKLAIFYEDSRNVAARDYPLHTLVCACLADALGRPIDDIRSASRAIPQNCDSKLLAACRDVGRMREPLVVALFDADKLHRLLKQPGNTPLDQLRGELDEKIGQAGIRTFLLERNTETLVDAAADCLERPRPTKSQLARDKLLGNAAWETSRASRDCIRDKVPSFATFIDTLAPLVSAVLPRVE